ncbi:cytoplasmic dynein 2 heavy chain 1-like isoform X2 [Oncorhynchus kisutch]|uniref:cytoplasmic dynein 2 heavy chain 1-like isoform X2 n=1 Tax=Oncorhynchus kisutch TaxID=8019 RepID=UPI0009A01607|nr:cytoplasmic dynein 2 heavy chain 1-like isoform X2 [Oncorhynchus kisutch]
MADIQRDSMVTSRSSQDGIRNSPITIVDQLQRCLKSLIGFLEEKHSALSWFYLLEILGQATNATVIQSHLKELFTEGEVIPSEKLSV